MSTLTIAVLSTLNSKGAEARFVCDVLSRSGVTPWLMDMSLKPHNDVEDAAVSGRELAVSAGTTWEALSEMSRSDAAEAMIDGATKVFLDHFKAGKFAGVIGVGGANNSTMACAVMRALPPLFPKVMVTPVAATAAVQWYVAQSDIAMFPTIGDISLNRITRAAMENAAWAVVEMARQRANKAMESESRRSLIGVSSFGGTQACVNRVTERLEAEGYEVIHFHASGPGGRALEQLSEIGELAGVIDITTSELTDLLTGGVYSAGAGRLKSAGAAGLPQVVVPGALDHTNFWVGEVPEKYRDREFFQYNVEILLMRTTDEEYEKLAHMMAERLNEAKGPVTVLIPKFGFSQHTIRKTHNLSGEETGFWLRPESDKVFTETLRGSLTAGPVRELEYHINDRNFADACVDEFLAMMKGKIG
ncbi:MAG: Tm-1-like ATP-binding domain-containing protein [Rhodospirillales bacterium]|nr:Tm-1-like ATP-binding domain-containing protein [Rhodospirillales bacterium]